MAEKQLWEELIEESEPFKALLVLVLGIISVIFLLDGIFLRLVGVVVFPIWAVNVFFGAGFFDVSAYGLGRAAMFWESVRRLEPVQKVPVEPTAAPGSQPPGNSTAMSVPKCSGCQSVASAGSKFCVHCGEPFDRS